MISTTPAQSDTSVHSAGAMAAAYVDGLQSQGVAATIKHFVGNDQEHERTAAESVMSDRALREIYLYPYAITVDLRKTSKRLIRTTPMVGRFMLAQKKAKPWAFMTSFVVSFCATVYVLTRHIYRYGRIDGVHCAENPALLRDILRKEWGFDGIVISDWHVHFDLNVHCFR